jgi:hypothetical protein
MNKNEQTIKEIHWMLEDGLYYFMFAGFVLFFLNKIVNNAIKTVKQEFDNIITDVKQKVDTTIGAINSVTKAGNIAVGATVNGAVHSTIALTQLKNELGSDQLQLTQGKNSENHQSRNRLAMTNVASTSNQKASLEEIETDSSDSEESEIDENDQTQMMQKAISMAASMMSNSNTMTSLLNMINQGTHTQTTHSTNDTNNNSKQNNSPLTSKNQKQPEPSLIRSNSQELQKKIINNSDLD